MKNDNKNNNKRQIILLVLFVALFTVLLFGGSLALFSYTKKGTVENKISTGYISFVFTDGQNIKLEDAMPISNKAGKKLNEACTFTVVGTSPKNTSIDYTVYATNGGKIGTKKRLKDSEIGIYVTSTGADDTHTVNIADKANGNYTINDLREVYNKGYVLATGSVKGQEEASTQVTYTVKMWISDIVELSDEDKNHAYTIEEFNNLYYTIKIRIDANA